MNIEIVKGIINEFNIDSIINDYKDNQIHYMREEEFDNWTYLSKDIMVLKQTEFNELIKNLNTLNNTILKKVVYHILKNDQKSLMNDIGMTEKIADIMNFIFNKLNISDYKQLPLTFYGRYDLLYDKNDNKFKVVEINSETPSGFPEAVSNNILTKNTILGKCNTLVDVNKEMELNLYKSLFYEFKKITSDKNKNNFLFTFIPASGDYFEMKKDETGKIVFEQEYDEDYTVSKHMTAFFYNQLNDKGVNVKLGNTDDIEFRKDGLYYMNEKQHYLWTFYPMEWIFNDKGGDEFWELFKKGEFEIINNPLNLITQSKAFWAYIYKNIHLNEDMGLTQDELNLLKELVPEYVFNIEQSEKNKYISKPLYFREGVGIGNDGYMGAKVYQKLIKQKPIEINTFEGPITGYLTLGIYMGEAGYIGTYTRFCENEITDYTAYYLPTLIDIEE